ncbi:Spliceosomal protein [Mycena chlorophos]|uniref:Spliceosomal protein n=2 Tax=Mycena chlorophos TaxID=658473 RepID=A0A146I476_MYCCL|nr:Spliceosomal protein [Mycena chlorophos]GAT54086.1 spliceosomal protein [Mycena chlorophos]
MSSSSPSPTLYLNNLNDKINKEELKTQLYALFTTYGKLIDVVASKSQRMRGQAFLVFADLAGATTAMRACDGMIFYDKPLRIAYAKTKSYATSRKEDPAFVPPTAVNASAIMQNGVDKKRQREDGAGDDERNAKREKQDQDDDDEEMEIEDDDEQQNAVASGEVPVPYPTARLLCTNLPQEVSDGVLSVLFQQYHGFKSTKVVPTDVPNVKKAQVFFDSPQLAAVAKEGLHGFTLKKDWIMSVQYI